MESGLGYLVMTVATGWAVTFGLRSLPFLLFAGKDRELPGWVERLGVIVSPVIIAGLIVYSFATLELGEGEAATRAWKTCWPYLAAALTVALQLLRRNPLVSIIAGTALYMFLVAGCTTSQVEFDAHRPLISVDSRGIKVDGEYCEFKRVPGRLEDYGIPHTATIHIALDPEMQQNLRPVRAFMAYLAQCGYTRSMLVTERHAESDRRKGAGSGYRASAPAERPSVRYKGANE